MIPENQQINLIVGGHCPYLNVSHPEMGFLYISKSNILQDGTAPFERFAPRKHDFWETANRPYCWTALPIFERLTAWKRDFWASAKWPSCNIALPISHRFEAWKRDSWTSANRTFCRKALLLFEHFAARKRDFWEVVNWPLCCPYSKFRTLKTRFRSIIKSTL